MVNPVNPAGGSFLPREQSGVKQRNEAPGTGAVKQDKLSFGQQKLTALESQNIVYERAMEKLRGVVEDARVELGIPQGAIIDPSPEATAKRILEFALNFFDKYAENNGLADDEAGRQQFAEFIGGAIGQGISEARDILGALSALSPEISGNIDKTAEVIEQGLSDFVANGLQR